MFNKSNSDNINNSNIEGSNVVIGDSNTNCNNTTNITNNQIINKSDTKFVFNEKKFKNLLDFIDAYFIEKKIYESEDYIPQAIVREQEKKNRRHNITETDYKKYIVEEIAPYEKNINDFFQDPRNRKTLKIYRQIINSLNMTLRAYDKNFENILTFFSEVIYKMKERYRDSIEDYEEDLISLFLYYAYYICDLDRREEE